MRVSTLSGGSLLSSILSSSSLADGLFCDAWRILLVVRLGAEVLKTCGKLAMSTGGSPFISVVVA